MAWLRDRFRYAFSGVRYGMLRDASIRLQILAAAAAMLVSAWLKISRDEWLWILLSCTLVIVVETLNSCIEKTVDYISCRRSPAAGLIKDMAAAAVFCASLFAFLCAILIWTPYLIALINA